MLFRPVNLAIVDDHALFRKVLKNFLSEQQSLNIVFQAENIADLFTRLESSTVDVLLMDIFLPELTGSHVIKDIRLKYPNTRLLILSMSTDLRLISDLLDAGIHGYISKADDTEDLLQAIQAIAENRIFRNRLFTEALYWNKQHNNKTYTEEPLLLFSEREKKMIQLIWEEKSNKEIAEELFLGIRSVEKIRQDMKEKAGVRSTVGLLKYAITKNILDIGRTPAAARAPD